MHPFTQESKKKKNRKLILSFLLSLTLVCSGFHAAVSAKNVPKTKGALPTANVKNNKKNFSYNIANNTPDKKKTEKVAFSFVIIGGVKLAEAAVTLASLYLVLCKDNLDVVKCVGTYVDNFNKANNITGTLALKLKDGVQQKAQELLKNQRKKGSLTPAQEAERIFQKFKQSGSQISISAWCKEQIQELQNSHQYDVAAMLQKLCSPFSKSSAGSTAPCEAINFKNNESARSFGMRFFQCWLQSLTADEKKAIHDYTDGEYHEINRCLRGQGPCSEDIEKMIEIITKALNRSSMPVGVKVKRGGALDILGELTSIATNNPQSLRGKEFSTPGFMSTGLVESRTDKVEMEIVIRKGTTGCAYVGSISANKKEEEVLCVSGKKLRITKVKVEGKKLVLEAEMIN